MLHGSSGSAGEQQCSTHVYQVLPRTPDEIRRALYKSLSQNASPLVSTEFWSDSLTGVMAEFLVDWASERGLL